MCTVLYLNDLRLLSKNRDKENAAVEEVISTGGILAVRTVGADYYSLGLNKNGCAFVSTAVNSPKWTAAVERGEIENAKNTMAAETQDKESASRWLSRLLPEVQSVDDWLKALKEADVEWRGYNLVLVDPLKAVHVEAHGRQFDIISLENRYIVTNHFRRLSWGARKRADYANSFDRFAYADEKIDSIENIDGLFAAIAPSIKSDRERIWRKGCFQTISSNVLDLKMGRLYHCVGEGQLFEEYCLLG